MSMLSSQIDELRELAMWLDDEFYDTEATKVRDAADTIWQLRDDLQRANAAVQDAEHDESMAWDRVHKAEAESEKLRSMVHDMRYCIKRNHRCDDCDFNVGADCLLFVNINKRMRELGVDG